MSDFAQRTPAGSLTYRAAKKRRRLKALPTYSAAGGRAADPVDAKEFHTARTSDGGTVRVDSELRKEIIEEAARLASGH